MFHDYSEDSIEAARAIKASLEYLQAEAVKAGIEFGALMIGVAAESVSDWLLEEQGKSPLAAPMPVTSNVIPLRRNQGQHR